MWQPARSHHDHQREKEFALGDAAFNEPIDRTNFSHRLVRIDSPDRLPDWLTTKVPRDHSERLGRALDLISQIFHRDGVFLDLARTHHIRTSFLEEQQAVWRRPECDTDRGSADPGCVLPPPEAAIQPTAM